MGIVELCSAAQRSEALPILRELYPWLDEGRYAALLAEMIDDGYRQFAVRNETAEIVALASSGPGSIRPLAYLSIMASPCQT
jgi:hypothetical protein